MCPSRRSIRSSRRAPSRASSRTRCRATSRWGRSSASRSGARARAASSPRSSTAPPAGVDARPIEAVIGSDPAAARRARAVARRLLRLDAGAGARPRRARTAEAAQGAGAARRPAVARPARHRRPSSRRRRSPRWRGSSTAARATCCSTARPARARPRCISRRARRCSNAGSGAIVLVPEIALAPQTVGRFRARFGEQIAILHSGADGRGAARRARADRERRGARRRRRALRGLRADCAGSA